MHANFRHIENQIVGKMWLFDISTTCSSQGVAEAARDPRSPGYPASMRVIN